MDWGAQHSFGVPISLGLVVSPHLVTWTVLGQGRSVRRKDGGHGAAAAPGGSITLTLGRSPAPSGFASVLPSLQEQVAAGS